MIKSFLAAVVAVGLIVGAVYVRGAFLGEGGGDPAASDGQPAAPADAGEMAVVCDAALAEGCPEGAERLDAAGILAAYAGDPLAYDVVVAPTALVELIEGSQTTQARFAAEREVVATTPLVVAVAPIASGDIDAVCGSSVTWGCLAELVVSGELSPGLTDPAGRTDGLVALAALTGGFLDRPAFTTNDLGGAAFLTWLDAIQAQGQVVAAPLEALIQFNGARNDSAVVLEAPAVGVVGRAAQNVPDLHWPTPLAHLAVTAVGLQATDADDVAGVAEDAAEALATVGWRDAGGALRGDPGVAGDPPGELPDDDGLPGGGTLFALQDRF